MIRVDASASETDTSLSAEYSLSVPWYLAFMETQVLNHVRASVLEYLHILKLTAKVGNMSSGTCTCEEGANSVCGPKLNDQIVSQVKGWVRKLGRVPGSLWGCSFLLGFVVKLSLIKLPLSITL